MSEYIASLVVIAALAAFAELISYSAGEDRGHKLAISVILLYAVISPLVPLVESLRELDFEPVTDTDFPITEDGAYLEVSEEAFREGIIRAVSEKWELPREKIAVSVIGFDFADMKAEYVMITLLGRGISVDYREIEKYIEDFGLGDCEVKYAIE